MAATKKKEAAKVKYSKEQYMYWYESMQLQRKFEEKAGQLYGQQKIRGFCHLYIGQEACSSGSVSALTKGDKYITAYRDHGHPLALGTDPNKIMAELYGKATGTTKGKGGSMHIFDKEVGFIGGHGIVGAQIPMGAGIGFAEKYLNTGKVCICYFGDGATRQGALHEAFNMAMTWKIPTIFVVENNGYAMGTSVERTSNITELYRLADAYGMPSEPVDGMSPESVHEAVSKAAAHIRAGNGPYFLEIRTYRYKGHSVSDPAKYRTKEEVQSYQDRDPLKVTEEKILQFKLATEAEIQEIKDRVKLEIDDCVEFAENSPMPPASELYTDNYVQEDYPFIRD